MRARKTINVSELVDVANEMLSWKENKPYITTEFKEGVCSLLEKMLHKTHSYNGFMFINNDDSDINTFGHVSRKYFKK